jgi:hypothetical protein
MLCLQGFKTLLTDSEDASFLFNAVLDAVVDHTMPVVQVRAVSYACIRRGVAGCVQAATPQQCMLVCVESLTVLSMLPWMRYEPHHARGAGACKSQVTSLHTSKACTLA